MIKNDKILGSVLSLFSAISISLVYIVSRSVQNSMKTDLFILWWFFFAGVWASFILVYKRKDFLCYIETVKKHKLFFIYFTLSETYGAFIFFYLIKIINPSVVSFLGSVTPLFVAIIAFFYIGEKMSARELLGGLISMAGVFLITYVSPDVKIIYVLMILSTVLIYSFNTVLVKKKTKDIPPILITLIRIFFLFLAYLFYNIVKGGIRLPDLREFILIAGGSLLGPILGMFALFSAFKYIKSTEVSLIKNSQPFFVILLSTVFLDIGIKIEQLVAGILIVIGISFIISEKRLGIRTILNRFIKN